MRIFVILHNGNRISVEADESDSVLDLKEKIKTEIDEDDSHLPLTFSSRTLDDDKPLSYYSMKHESEVHVKGKQNGYSLPAGEVKTHSDRKTIKRKTNWVLDNSFISFKPIIDRSVIPFYNAVTQQDSNYHQGLNDDDKYWINKYTGPDYKKLKVQSYTLNPNAKQLKFLKKLYLACWVAEQDNLPDKVYHVCNLTEMSYSWLTEELIFYTPAFVSASTNEELKWSGNCKWEILLQKGKRHHVVDVKEFSQHPEEDEILLSCCTRFKVISKREAYQEEFKYYVQLEYLDL